MDEEGALMSAVCAKKWYGFTFTMFGVNFQTSSRSSMMHTMPSPHGNKALKMNHKRSSKTFCILQKSWFVNRVPTSSLLVLILGRKIHLSTKYDDWKDSSRCPKSCDEKKIQKVDIFYNAMNINDNEIRPNPAIVCAYSRAPNVQMCSSYKFDIFWRNSLVCGRSFVWYQSLVGPWGISKWNTSFNRNNEMKWIYEYIKLKTLRKVLNLEVGRHGVVSSVNERFV